VRRSRRWLRTGLLLAPIMLLAAACRQQSSPTATVFVYKPDGTVHCGKTGGTPLASMARELTRDGVSIFSQRKSHDGREGIAICGQPTGGINVYEIAESDLPQASSSGFQQLDPSWLDVP
jgi:hypothetical protein